MGQNTNLVDLITARQPTNSVEIFREEDFPAAVGTGPEPAVITLVDDTTYLIRAFVTLSANIVISVGDSVIFQGTNIEVSAIIGNVDAPLIETTGATGVRLQMRDLMVQNTGSIPAGAEDVRIVQNPGEAGAAELTRCSFRTAPVRVHSGLGAAFTRCGFLGGSSLIQGGGGGTGGLTLAINDLCTFNDQDFPLPDGLLQFAAGNFTQTVGLRDTLFVMSGAGTVGIVIDGTPIVLDSVLFGAPVFVSLFTDHFGFKMQNPDDINRVEIIRTNFSGGGELFLLEPVRSFTVDITPPNGFVYGVGITGTGDGETSAGGNMITVNVGTSQGIITLHDGLTAAVLDSFVTPNTQPRDVTWHRGDLYSCDPSGTGSLFRHDGFSDTIISDLTSIPGGVAGIVFVGDDLVICSASDGLVRVFEGFSLTLLASFDSGFDQAAALAFDGINLIIMDNESETVNVMKGVSATVMYSFQAATADGRGVAHIPGNGFLICDLGSNVVDVYDNPVTFDHSSVTWQVLESPNVVLSSDRGGAAFSNLAGINILISDIGDWIDLKNEDLNLFYGGFSENEKCFLSDEINGEITWTGVRDRGRIVAAQATFRRSEGNAGEEVAYEIALAIDRGIGYVIQGDTIASSVQRNTIDFTSVSTMPVTRDLVAGDRIKIQIRNNSTIDDVLLTASKVAIT